jgi:serine/threonine-protein phosphatase 5
MHAFARLQTKKIHKRYIARVLLSSKKYLSESPSLLRISIPKHPGDTRITIVGDIHGDLYAMLHIFDTNGFPSLDHRYIFNGDVLDKGYRSMETLISLLMIQLSCPDCIMITRGNHEDEAYLQSRVQTELQRLYGSGFFPLLVDVVNVLPLATLVQDEILVVHGGIIQPNLTLEDINQTIRGTGISLMDSNIMTDLLWSDPSDDHLGVEENVKRWKTFGKDIVDSFLAKNNLSLLVRSHQVAMDGTRVHHSGKTITIYSAPMSKSSMRGGYMNIDSSMVVTCHRFKAAPFPKISWKKYGF